MIEDDDDFSEEELQDIPEEAEEFWESYDPTDSEEPTPITKGHIELIRSIRLRWHPAEVGAPSVDWFQPYGSPDPLKDVARALGKAPLLDLAKRHADMTQVLNTFLRSAELPAGNYSFNDRTIGVTEEHLELVCKLYFRWDPDWSDYWPTPTINPKRPYGAFTNFEKEMALHLGWLSDAEERELSEAEEERLTRMHHEMLDVLRVFLARATLP